ncbi:MAG: hypothetical protein COA79_06420 [Planctomycetota bacterium]|nr:MAG: hypothetical protein COA79_06420 [Planctomycetota bacterium]
MSRFNRIFFSHKCSECKQAVTFNVQFRYGELDDHSYTLGDRIKWGTNNKGDARHSHVIVDGMGFCPKCRGTAGFIVKIHNNLIADVSFSIPDSDDFEESGYTILESFI